MTRVERQIEEITSHVKALYSRQEEVAKLLQEDWHPAIVRLIGENEELKTKVKALEEAYAELLLTGNTK